MTLEQALQKDCPYKPHSTDLFSGQSLSKCIGLPCMCWVEVTEPTYTDVKSFSGTYKDRDRFLQENPSYENISTKYGYSHPSRYESRYESILFFTLGIPVTEPQGYCTLRGDIQ